MKSAAQRHRRLEFHNPSNPACRFSADPGVASPDADWCSCPHPAAAFFTHPDPSPLEVGMDTNSEIEEAAFFDLLAAREAAIQGATGALAMLNVPTERLQLVAQSTDRIISLAARIVLYQRDPARLP